MIQKLCVLVRTHNSRFIAVQRATCPSNRLRSEITFTAPLTVQLKLAVYTCCKNCRRYQAIQVLILASRRGTAEFLRFGLSSDDSVTYGMAGGEWYIFYGFFEIVQNYSHFIMSLS
jgi:hypothetical protein